MNRHRSRTSALGRVITRYLALKRALGFAYSLEGATLRALEAFLRTEGGPTADLRPASFTQWTHTLEHLTPTVRRNRLRTVRNLCRYRRRTEPDCFVPDPSGFPAPHHARPPHIFTPDEIARLLRATRTLAPTPHRPLRVQAMRLALVLLYTAGLRRGELLRLTVGDYDPREQILLIRASKFHKSRAVPLSPDAVGELERYLRARRRHQLPMAAETPLLAYDAMGRRAYSACRLGALFRTLLRQTAIRTADGRLPRLHDLRHGFAVHALLRWYRQGLDVQARLPFLATYMGHVSIASTHSYLAFVEPLRAAATARFARHCGALIGPRTPAPGRRP